MHIRGPPPGLAPRCQQTHLRIGARPEAQPIKPAIRPAVLFQPDERHGFIGETPRLNQPQGLRELGERGPKEQGAVRGRDVGHRQGAQLVNAHGGIVPLRRPLQALLGVAPGRVSVDNGISSDGYTPFPPWATASSARRTRSEAGP